MPDVRTAHAVRLEFTPGSRVQANLSGAAFTGDWLWVAGDEACGLDRLRRLDPVGREALRFGEGRDFPLADLLHLPGAAGEAADLEGMALADVCLRVVGLHGLKRKNIRPDRGDAGNARGPATVGLDGNRRLLACLPIEPDANGAPCLMRQALDDSGALIRKHLLPLDGLGVRDLHFCGDDLCIPAGPTIVPNGETLVFNGPAARPLPHRRGTSRAEAICVPPPALVGGKASWLVLYDAPGADRKEGEHTVFGDLLHRD